MKWQTAEILGCAYFADKGYRIFVPLVSAEGYDFIAVSGHTMIRVNVKVAGLKTKTRRSSWSISKASGSHKQPADKADCDVFLVYMKETEQFIELPGNFFNGCRSKSKLIPKESL